MRYNRPGEKLLIKLDSAVQVAMEMLVLEDTGTVQEAVARQILLAAANQYRQFKARLSDSLTPRVQFCIFLINVAFVQAAACRGVLFIPAGR